MLKVIISGYGRMGHMVEQQLAHYPDMELVAASEDIVATDPAVAGDCVCIDFTTPDAFRANYRAIARLFKAAVVGTTGWNDIAEDVFAAFRAEGKTLIWASNFSIGVNALFAAVSRVCDVLKDKGYTPAISETHHIHKLDAPSGTAKSLGTLVERHLGAKPEITAYREGEVPGIHTVTLESAVDRLTLTHEAFSREGLAAGAVIAARMTRDVSSVHEFSELILG